MTDPALKVAKLANSRYEISLQSGHDSIKCYIIARLPGPALPGDATSREPERRQLALKKAKSLATALDAAIIET